MVAENLGRHTNRRPRGERSASGASHRYYGASSRVNVVVGGENRRIAFELNSAATFGWRPMVYEAPSVLLAGLSCVWPQESRAFAPPPPPRPPDAESRLRSPGLPSGSPEGREPALGPPRAPLRARSLGLQLPALRFTARTRPSRSRKSDWFQQSAALSDAAPRAGRPPEPRTSAAPGPRPSWAEPLVRP
jgi:hypothetical protein